ncbi:MAG: FkbM family methyltransferase [Planctomycetes bacterium]|nr:FkbM family methyltransferase [Planctomycetota bacterium]
MFDGVRHVLNAWRRRQAERRLARAVPDTTWREICRPHAACATSFRQDATGGLVVHGASRSVRLPPTENGRALASAADVLVELLDVSEASIAWDDAGDVLLVSQGGAVYPALSFENLYVLRELLLAGDYDLRLPAPTLVLDVGANCGFTSVFLAAANSDAQIVAVEPLASCHARMTTVLARNPDLAARIHPAELALLDHDGETEVTYVIGRSVETSLVQPEASRGRPTRTQTIRLRDAAAFLREQRAAWPGRPVVLKLDCEGSEGRVLRRLQQTGLLGGVDCVVMEWHRVLETGGTPDFVVNLLVGSGFYVHVRHGRDSRARIGMVVAARGREHVAAEAPR